MSDGKLEVLLIEDDTTLGSSLKSSIEKWGHNVEWIPNPSNLQKTVNIKDFHLAIIDSMLPTANGFLTWRLVVPQIEID